MQKNVRYAMMRIRDDDTWHGMMSLMTQIYRQMDLQIRKYLPGPEIRALLVHKRRFPSFSTVIDPTKHQQPFQGSGSSFTIPGQMLTPHMGLISVPSFCHSPSQDCQQHFQPSLSRNHATYNDQPANPPTSADPEYPSRLVTTSTQPTSVLRQLSRPFPHDRILGYGWNVQ